MLPCVHRCPGGGVGGGLAVIILVHMLQIVSVLTLRGVSVGVMMTAVGVMMTALV